LIVRDLNVTELPCFSPCWLLTNRGGKALVVVSDQGVQFVAFKA
jgi:hypothetical protein